MNYYFIQQFFFSSDRLNKCIFSFSFVGKPCYSICFDNVNQKTTVRHQTRDKKNKMFNMVQAYAALDRINSLHLSDDSPSPEDVESIPLHKLLPCEMDEVDLRSQMTVIVERILCTHIPFFEDVKDNIIWHIPHQYSNESAQKSEMVGLIMCQSNTIFVWKIFST